jgi:hypothetical protein
MWQFTLKYGNEPQHLLIMLSRATKSNKGGLQTAIIPGYRRKNGPLFKNNYKI